MKKRVFAASENRTGAFKSVLMLAFLLVAGLSGCQERACGEPEPVPVIGFCGTGTGEAACGTEATVVMDSCFPAYWGEVMLQLDNGDQLRPWEGLPLNQSLQNGQRVRIGYEPSNAPQNYHLICNTFQAIPPFTPIKITCFEPGLVPSGNN